MELAQMIEMMKKPPSPRRVWGHWLKWPAPAWRLRGYCEAPVGKRSFKFDCGLFAPIWFYRDLRTRNWESAVINFIETNLKCGQTFVDVGAWIGAYSMLAAQLVGETGKVYAFEPDPLARQFLRRNLKANGVGGEVEVIPLAVSNRVGVKIMDYEAASSGSRISDEASISKAPNVVGKVKVEATTLDEFSESIRQFPDIIKIDVEGHEVEVMEGALRTLSNRKTTIIMEVHDEILQQRGVNPTQFIHRIERIRGTEAICLETKFLHATQLAGHQAQTRHIVIGSPNVHF